MRPRTIVLAAIATALLAGSGYSLWHAWTYSSAYISVNDYGLATSKLLYGQPHNVRLELLSAEGKLLAVAQSVEPYGYLSVMHPDADIGNCVQHDSRGPDAARGRENYAQCFKRLSRWITQWASTVKSANFSNGQCEISNVPAKVTTHLPDWWMWWFPNPHAGGFSYRYVYIEVAVNSRTCKAVLR